MIGNLFGQKHAHAIGHGGMAAGIGKRDPGWACAAQAGLDRGIHDPGPVTLKLLLGDVGERPFRTGDFVQNLGRGRQFGQIPARPDRRGKDGTVLAAVIGGRLGALLWGCFRHFALGLGQFRQRPRRADGRGRREEMRRIVKVRWLEQAGIGGLGRAQRKKNGEERQAGERQARANLHQNEAFKVNWKFIGGAK